MFCYAAHIWSIVIYKQSQLSNRNILLICCISETHNSHKSTQIRKSANPRIYESANPQINESTNLSVCMGGCACYTIVISEKRRNGTIIATHIYRCIYTYGEVHCTACGWTWKYIALHVVGAAQQAGIGYSQSTNPQIHTNPQIRKSANPQINESTDLPVCAWGDVHATLL